jgi:hypothetical protein
LALCWPAIAQEAPQAPYCRQQAQATPFQANTVWAYDFVFDTTAESQQIKCLAIVDECIRECLAIDVAGSIRSRRVIDVLSKLVSSHGAPLFMRSDNEPEFVKNPSTSIHHAMKKRCLAMPNVA